MAVPAEALDAIARAVRDAFGFTHRVPRPWRPGAEQSWYRAKDKPRKGEFWPQLHIHRSRVELVAYEWLLDVWWDDVPQTWGWHESGDVPPDDRALLVHLANATGLVGAYREDQIKRKEWPHRGTRRIPGIGTKSHRKLAPKEDAPPDKDQKIEVKNAWHDPRVYSSLPKSPSRTRRA